MYVICLLSCRTFLVFTPPATVILLIVLYPPSTTPCSSVEGREGGRGGEGREGGREAGEREGGRERGREVGEEGGNVRLIRMSLTWSR